MYIKRLRCIHVYCLRGGDNLIMRKSLRQALHRDSWKRGNAKVKSEVYIIIIIKEFFEVCVNRVFRGVTL